MTIYKGVLKQIGNGFNDKNGKGRSITTMIVGKTILKSLWCGSEMEDYLSMGLGEEVEIEIVKLPYLQVVSGLWAFVVITWMIGWFASSMFWGGLCFIGILVSLAITGSYLLSLISINTPSLRVKQITIDGVVYK